MVPHYPDTSPTEFLLACIVAALAFLLLTPFGWAVLAALVVGAFL